MGFCENRLTISRRMIYSDNASFERGLTTGRELCEMYIDKRLLKKVGFCFSNWMIPELFDDNKELKELAELLEEYDRNYASMDYPTEKDFDSTLLKFLKDNHVEVEDEKQFIREIKKNLNFTPWWE